MADVSGESKDKLSIYISGAHSVGKTTLHEALQRNEEFANFSFKAQAEIARPWVNCKGYTQEDFRNRDCFFKLQKELTELQILKEQNEIDEFHGEYSRFLWDRGIIDPVIYVKEYIGREEADKFCEIPGVKVALERWRESKETLVFLPKPEREFLVLDGTRRESDHEEIFRIHKSMMQTLESLDIPFKEITAFDIERRVQTVIQEVKRKWPWMGDLQDHRSRQ